MGASSPLQATGPRAGLASGSVSWLATGGVSSTVETLSQHNPEAKGNKWGVGLFTQQRLWLPRRH